MRFIRGILLLVTWLYLAANIVILGGIIDLAPADIDSVATPP